MWLSCRPDRNSQAANRHANTDQYADAKFISDAHLDSQCYAHGQSYSDTHHQSKLQV